MFMYSFKKSYLISLFCFIILVFFLSQTGFTAEKEGAHGVNVLKEVWKWINFIIFVFAIYKFLSKPAKEFLFTRSESIRILLSESKDSLLKAEKKLKDSEILLKGLEKEVEEIKRNVQKQNEIDKEKIASETDKLNRKIAEQINNDIEQLYKKAEMYVSNQIVAEATKIAEESLKKEFTKDNQRVLVQKYIDALGEMK